MAITARIVVSQTGNPPPGGYTDGSRDLGPLLANLVTCSNFDNSGVVAYRWTFSGRVGLTTVDYGLSGLEGPTLTFTPPASVGYGDVYVTLDVWDANGNKASAQALIGIRAPSLAYVAGVPIPHWKESALGGKVTLDASRGREGRVHELALALLLAVGVGGLMPGGSGTVRVDGGIASAPDYVKVGSNPAGAGALRTANASIAVGARNAANSGDLTLLSSDASDTAILGAVAKPTKINGSSITLSALALAPGYGAPSGTAFAFSSATVAVTDGADTTLSSTQYNCHDLNCTGALTANRNVIVPLTAGGTWRIINATTGGFAVVVKGATGTGVTVATGTTAIVRSNGTNVVLIGSAGGGGGGSTPTGTGFVHVTAGVQDGAAQLVVNADVNAAAAIDVTKLALGAANKVLWSDGATNQWANIISLTRIDLSSNYRLNGGVALGYTTTTLEVGAQTTWTSISNILGNAGTFDWYFAATKYLSISQSAGALALTPAVGAASFTLQQTDTTTASATGAATVIGAQWATGTTATGGAMSIIAGYGTAQGGAAMLRGGDATAGNGGDVTVAAGAGTGGTNGTLKLGWGNSTGINYVKSSTTITALAGASYTSLTHGYTDLGTNSATGGVMAVRGQTCTGTTSIGGDMRVGPGGGTLRPGQLLLAFGTTDLVTFSFNASGYQWTIDSSATSVTWNQTGASGAGTGAVWSITAQSRTSGTGGEMRLGGGTGSGSSTHGAVTFYVGGSEVGRFDTSGAFNAKKITGLSGNAFAYVNLLKDVSASGTITLSSSEYCVPDIEFYGTLTAATIVDFPATTGAQWTVTNSQAGGAFSLALRAAGSTKLVYLGKAQTLTVRCDGTHLYAIDKGAVVVLAEGLIDYNGAVGNLDTTIYTISGLSSVLVTGIELYLDVAQVGGGSSTAVTVGDTAGGTQWILTQTITTATTLGTAYGLDTTHLGSNFDATKGYTFFSNRASKSIIVRCARSGATVTAGKLRYVVLGRVSG